VDNVIMGHKLKVLTGIPWVNEYRDLWYGNPYKTTTKANKEIEFSWEKEMISEVDALVTVSEPLKEDLVRYHNKPTYVVYNGYDDGLDQLDTRKHGPVHVVYTGYIYKGKRDPELLFRALSELKIENPKLAAKIKVSFYGQGMLNLLTEDVRRWDLSDTVLLNEAIEHGRVIEIQKNADILLLLGWNDPKEKGVATGKLFEYIGRKKMIMAITYPLGVVADILQKTNLGKVFSTTEEIKLFLTSVVQGKQADFEPDIIEIKKFSRNHQVKYLSELLLRYSK
jgi:hypothetical protein